MRRDRRTFIGALGALLATPVLGNNYLDQDYQAEIACNQYTWYSFYKREGQEWTANLDESLKQFTSSGIKGYEPSIGSEKEIDVLLPLLKKYNLQMTSVYVNSTLHENETANKSIEEIVTYAKRLSKEGVRIFVTNPSPIRWGGTEDKTDAQLVTQARSLDTLGKRLREIGVTLAYHNHDPELRSAAREFHHMMQATNPQNVRFCLDAHWIYRGSGNSQVALFDVLKMYGKRVVEVHLRQSRDGIWTETLSPGDIDYERFAAELRANNVKPHLVIEQAVENGTPATLSPVEAHRQSLAYMKTVFG